VARFLHNLRKWNGAGASVLAAVFLLCCAVFFSACEEIEEEKPWIQVDRPQMLFTDTTLLDSYNGNVLSWKLKTAYLERWADKEIVFVRPIFVDIYDSVGERAAFLRADSGRFDMKFTYVNAYGHVYALTPKGASVRADSLIWNKADNLVRTESYVRVVSEDGDVLQGKGFQSDAKMDNWKILANVTAIFQDAANRLKEEDQKEAKAHALDSLKADSVQKANAASAQNAPQNPAPAPQAGQPAPAPAKQGASASSGAPAPASPATGTTASPTSLAAEPPPDTSTGPREMNPEADAELLKQSRRSLQNHMRPRQGKDSATSAPAPAPAPAPAKKDSSGGGK
jgi:LPS export ABC transporter protein LptC